MLYSARVIGCMGATPLGGGACIAPASGCGSAARTVTGVYGPASPDGGGGGGGIAGGWW
jgi:hypothetical protein